MKTPRSALILCIAAALPALGFPMLLASQAAIDHPILIWVYPFYVVGSCFTAWSSWTSRRDIAWILLTLTLLSHACVYALAFMPPVQ